MPSPDMLLWHPDYLEQKVLGSQLVQEGHSDLPFSSWKQKMKLLFKRASPYTRRKEAFLSPEMWSRE